jgi:hypothetical protein
MTRIEAAQVQLRQIHRDVEAIRFRLLGVKASLPPSGTERNPLLEDDTMDATEALRAVIDCLLEDRIAPLLRDLQVTGSVEDYR